MEKWKNFISFEDSKEILFSRARKKVLPCFESRIRKKFFLLKFYSFGINSKEALFLKVNQEFERNSFY